MAEAVPRSARASGTGFLLGKFLPLHKGHQYMIEFARSFVERLAVVVCSIEAEPIDGKLRFEWMTTSYPDLDVVHLTDEIPQAPEEHPDFWNIWREALHRILPFNPDYVFASEPYGWRLAEEMEAEFVPVDFNRSIVPVSGSRIRENPVAYWDYLPPCVRPYYLKRVCVFGPESTGKTSLARRLAKEFDTVWVPEYAREYLEAKSEKHVTASDLEKIAYGQAASEDVLATHARQVLFCDTDVLTTTLWSRVLVNDVPAWMQTLAESRNYDLYLVTDVDVPWVEDPIRYLPDERVSFMKAACEALDRLGRNYVVVRGTWAERDKIASDALRALLEDSTNVPT